MVLSFMEARFETGVQERTMEQTIEQTIEGTKTNAASV